MSEVEEFFDVLIEDDAFKAVQKLAAKEGGTPADWLIVSLVKFFERYDLPRAESIRKRLEEEAPEIVDLLNKF